MPTDTPMRLKLAALAFGSVVVPVAVLVGLIAVLNLDDEKGIFPFAACLVAFFAVLGSMLAGKNLQRRLWPSANRAYGTITVWVVVLVVLSGSLFLFTSDPERLGDGSGALAFAPLLLLILVFRLRKHRGSQTGAR